MAFGGDLRSELRAARRFGPIAALPALIGKPCTAASLFLSLLRRPAGIAPARLERLATFVERRRGGHLAGSRLARLVQLPRRERHPGLEIREAVALGKVLLASAGGE